MLRRGLGLRRNRELPRGPGLAHSRGFPACGRPEPHSRDRPRAGRLRRPGLVMAGRPGREAVPGHPAASARQVPSRPSACPRAQARRHGRGRRRGASRCPGTGPRDPAAMPAVYAASGNSGSERLRAAASRPRPAALPGGACDHGAALEATAARPRHTAPGPDRPGPAGNQAVTEEAGEAGETGSRPSRAAAGPGSARWPALPRPARARPAKARRCARSPGSPGLLVRVRPWARR